MKKQKKGEYLAPEAEVMEICISDSLLIAASETEDLLGGNVYGDGDFI